MRSARNSGPSLRAGWAPRAGWAVGIGARCGLSTDVHEVRDVRRSFGARVDAEAVPLRVSLNGQQFGEEEAAPGWYVVGLLMLPLEPAVFADGLKEEPRDFPAILGADVAAVFRVVLKDDIRRRAGAVGPLLVEFLP